MIRFYYILYIFHGLTLKEFFSAMKRFFKGGIYFLLYFPPPKLFFTDTYSITGRRINIEINRSKAFTIMFSLHLELN